MLRRQYKKRRNKKGGRNFFDAVSEGTEQWKSAATIAKNKGMEAAANTQQGIADFEASRQAGVMNAISGTVQLLDAGTGLAGGIGKAKAAKAALAKG